MESGSRIVHEHGAVVVRATAVTDPGRVRPVNEDAVVVAPPAFAVFDGMGGHTGGRRASGSAAAVFEELFHTDRPAEVDDVIAAIEAANLAVLQASREAGDATVSGTTLTGIALVASGAAVPNWLVFNAGDSRVYRLTPDGIVQLTVDHSLVQELVAAGEITEAEALVHPERHVITRALGAGPVVDPDVWLMPVEQGDVFILCSDGLPRELDDRRIAETVRDAWRLGQSPAERLVEAANNAGARDNVSAVVVELEIEGVPRDANAETVDRLPRALEETNPRNWG